MFCHEFLKQLSLPVFGRLLIKQSEMENISYFINDLLWFFLFLLIKPLQETDIRTNYP